MLRKRSAGDLFDVCSILDDVSVYENWKKGILSTLSKTDDVLTLINQIRTVIAKKHHLDLTDKENVDLVDEIAQEYCRCHISYEQRMSEKKADDAELRAKIKQKERSQQKMSRQASKPKAKKEFYF